MSTRDYFEGVRRNAKIHGHGKLALESSFEFIHGYPMPRIHGRPRQPLPTPLLLGSTSLTPEKKEEKRPKTREEYEAWWIRFRAKLERDSGIYLGDVRLEDLGVEINGKVIKPWRKK
jgi:hypothetical protein